MQDFASYRNTPDSAPSEAYSTAWTPDVPSIIFGVLIGVFVAFIGLKAAEYRADQAVFVEVPAVEVSTTLTVQSVSIGSSDLDSCTPPLFPSNRPASTPP